MRPGGTLILEKPRLVHTTPVAYAGLRLTIPKDQIRHVMGPGLEEVHAALAVQGVAPAGPWFTHHLRIDPHGWDFEICVPVAGAFAAHGRVAPRVWPAMRVVRAVLRGDYEGLTQAWPTLDAWVREQGLTPAEDLWEVYAVGPEAGAEPAAWRTELIRPLAAG